MAVRPFTSLLVLVLLGGALLSGWADEPVGDVAVQRQALAQFQPFIGEWRGVGQPRRGSAKDAWSEEGQWSWSFPEHAAALEWVSPNGKYVRRATLTLVAAQPIAGKSVPQFELRARMSDGSDVRYLGAPNPQGHLILESPRTAEALPAKISLRVVASGDRLVVLYERRLESDRFARMAEVGMTRKGSGFGQGTSFVECVVTGGVGTIAVSHEGQTYYVCCTGCRDYFNDNAAEVLAEYRQRKEAAAKKPAP